MFSWVESSTTGTGNSVVQADAEVSFFWFTGGIFSPALTFLLRTEGKTMAGRTLPSVGSTAVTGFKPIFEELFSG